MHIIKYADLCVGSLLSVNVGLAGATTKKEKVTLRKLCAEHKVPIKQPTVCPYDGEVLDTEGITFGWEQSKDVFLEVTPQERESIQAVKAPRVPITKFVAWSETGTLARKATYYLVPPSVGFETYALMVRMLEENCCDAFGHAVLFKRDEPFIVTPMGGRLLLHLLVPAHELVAADFDVPNGGTIKPQEVKLGSQIVKMFTEPLTIDDLASDSEALLRALVLSKVKGKSAPKVKLEKPLKPTGDLQEALRKTIAAGEKALVVA